MSKAAFLRVEQTALILEHEIRRAVALLDAGCPSAAATLLRRTVQCPPSSPRAEAVELLSGGCVLIQPAAWGKNNPRGGPDSPKPRGGQMVRLTLEAA